jgi:hypothetical protein
MWYLSKIPKIAHFYWGGRQLSYLQYLTIVNFKKLNPDWKINFYFPAHPQIHSSWGSYEQKYNFCGDDYFNKLMELGVDVKKIECKELGFSEDISEVHKSDFLRWYLLSTVGGLWSDMDILYFRPIENMSLNCKENSEIDTIVSICRYGHSIGFLLSSPNNKYFKELWDNSHKYWTKENYQSIGVSMINKLFPSIESINKILPELKVINLSMSTVYPLDATQIKNIFRSISSKLIHRDTIGLHWYAGHPLAGEFLFKTAGGYFSQQIPCLISRLMNNEIGRTTIAEAVNLYLLPTDKVLDIGSGVGVVASEIKGKVTTLDIWEKFKPQVLHDLNNLPLPFSDNSFDVILALDIIEHLDFDRGELLLKELKRITRRSIILLTPLWWTDNHENIIDPQSPYYQNPYNTHKSLWVIEDLEGWNRIQIKNTYDNYFFGEWMKDKESGE